MRSALSMAKAMAATLLCTIVRISDVWGRLIAEIDLGAIGVAKNAADPAGHYSRPDVTRLLLNKKPLRRVEEFSLPLDSVAPEEQEQGATALRPSQAA